MDKFSLIQTPQELLEYMKRNITYGFVGKNGKRYTDRFSDDWNDWYDECFVQSGEEVLNSRIGTCWDQVELERLWFEQKGFIIHTFFMLFEVNKENEYPTHTFLIYENDSKFYWFENSFESERGIHEFSSLDDAVERVKSKQIEYTRINYDNVTDDNMNSLVVYEYSKPGRNLNVDEYLNHVTNTKYIKSN